MRPERYKIELLNPLLFFTASIFSQTSGQLRELLDTALSWDFEIFKLEELTRGRPLLHLGMQLVSGRFDACASLECDEKTFLNWLTVIEMNYHSRNTYHNSTHAADVLQVCYLFCTSFYPMPYRKLHAILVKVSSN